MSERDDASLGFRPLLTRAPIADGLLATPSEYDAAPTYLTTEYSQRTEEVKRAIALQTTSEVSSRARGQTLGGQVRIAVELAAPIGMGLVRSFALVQQLGAVIAAANPVMAVLTLPALFFTGRRTLNDLRRAFVVDPRVRALVEQANSATQVSDFARAESLLKTALKQEIDPTYGRNGDLYLQLGTVQMLDRRPRQAMVSLAKASVLFGETDAFRYEVDSKVVTISKRGWTELLACAAIDSFATDEAGIDEWSAVMHDFASSARRRFESFSSSQEAGQIFGLFGVDAGAAQAGRELAAKARFLAAKVRLRALGMGASAEVDALLEQALSDIETASGLTETERFQAVLEQAQFHARAALGSNPLRAPSARRALMLMDRAAGIVERSSPGLAARTRAEAAAFLLETLPAMVAKGENVAGLREEIDALLARVSTSLRGPARSFAMASVATGWVEEQRFHLATVAQDRAQAIERAYHRYSEAGEPVAAMYSALRLAYLAAGQTEARPALTMLMTSARSVLSSPTDPVSLAFAAKYLIKASEVAGQSCPEASHEQAAEWFLAAAAHVAQARALTAFHLHGRVVIHADPIAVLILRAQAAQLLAQAGQAQRANALLEELRASLPDLASESVQMGFELERATLLAALGQPGEAKDVLEAVERQARAGENMALHRRALELLHELASRPTDSTATGPSLPAQERVGQGLMEAFATQRAKLLRGARTLLTVLEQPSIRQRLDAGGSSTSATERVRERIERVEQSRFRIAIVGEFSSGKSTFLNALLGEAVLPSAVRPTTATSNRLYWGETPALRVLYSDKHTEETTIERLPDFVTERSNPGNKHGVERVEIAYPLELLREGVELLDTPGISSLIAAHTKTTLDILPTCDAVVLLATGRQPFSESIGRFFDELRLAVEGKVFYVLNKIDQVEEAKRVQAIDFASHWVGQKMPGVQVRSVAAYHALVGRRLNSGSLSASDVEDDPRLGEERDPARLIARSGMPELEQALGEFLLHHRGAPLLKSVASELLALLRTAERALGAEREASRMTARERREHHERLKADLAERRREIDQMLTLMSQRFERLALDVEGRARSDIPALLEPILTEAAIVAADAESEARAKELSARLGEVARRHIRRWMEEALHNSTGELLQSFEQARREMAAHRRDLSVSFGSVFQTSFADTTWDESLPITIEGAGDWVTAVSVPALLGLLGGFLLGPLAILIAGPLGSLLAGVIMGDETSRRERIVAQIKPVLEERLNGLSQTIGASVAERLRDVTQQCLEGLQGAREGMMADFDRELDALVASSEQEVAASRDIERLIRSLQEQASHARKELEQISKGEIA